MVAMDINTYNPLPEQTFYSDTMATRVFFDDYNSGRLYTSATGKNLLGLVDPADVSCELRPDLEPVESGAVTISLEEIVTGYQGSCRITMQDLNPSMLEVMNGTTIPLIDVEPSTPVTGTVTGAGSTLTTVDLGSGEGAGFTVGDTILVPGAARDMYNFVKSIATDTLTLVYQLSEVPLTGGTAKKLEGFEMNFGGNASLPREFVFAQDFGKGAEHRNVIWRGTPISGFNQTGGGVVKSSGEIKIQGVARSVNGSNQITPMTMYGTYGTVSA